MSCPPATPRASTRESKPLALAVGTRLGAYEVIGLLGSGGMGDVYRARDPRLGRVYRLLAKYGGDDEANAYLQRAAEAFTRAMTLDTDSTVAHNLYTAFEVESEGRAVDATVRLIGRLRDRPDPELFAGLVLSCRFCGLLDASVAADRQARRLDPAIRTSIMYTHFARGDWEQAIATDVEDARWVTKYALLVLGRPDEAMASFRETENRPLPVLLRRLMMVSRLALEGRRDECVAASRAFTAGRTFDPEGLYFAARALAHIDESALALAALERGARLLLRVLAGARPVARLDSHGCRICCARRPRGGAVARGLCRFPACRRRPAAGPAVLKIRSADAARADPPLVPVAGSELLDADDAARARRVDEFAVAERDADVGGAAAHRLEEHEIPGLHLVAIDEHAGVELILDLARQLRPVLREYPLYEPAAVEAGWVGASVAIRRAAQVQCGRQGARSRGIGDGRGCRRVRRRRVDRGQLGPGEGTRPRHVRGPRATRGARRHAERERGNGETEYHAT